MAPFIPEVGIKAIVRRKKQPYTKGNQHHIFDNLLEQNFTTEKPNLVWCTDFTYQNLKNGATRYNCSIIDLYDRSIVASLNSKWIDSSLAIETLAIALESNSINDQLILHSDQGSQYTSREFIAFCAENDITQSMSGVVIHTIMLQWSVFTIR